MKPQDRNTILDILFESTIAISELFSFESIFAWKDHPIIKNDIEKAAQAVARRVHSSSFTLVAHSKPLC